MPPAITIPQFISVISFTISNVTINSDFALLGDLYIAATTNP